MPLAWWLFIAILVESATFKRSRTWNAWLTLSFAILTLFRLFWTMWVLSFPVRDLTSFLNTDALREKLSITLVMVLAATAFVPFVILALGRVWRDRKACGPCISLLRALPVCGATYLFLSDLIMAGLVISDIRLQL